MKASIDLTIKVVGDEVEDVRIWAWLADGRHFGCHTESVDPIGEGESYTYSYTIEGEEVEKLLAATGAKDDPSEELSSFFDDPENCTGFSRFCDEHGIGYSFSLDE
jgi:hypothetical protein